MFGVCSRAGGRPRFEAFLLLIAVCTPLAYIWTQQAEFGFPLISRWRFQEQASVHIPISPPLKPQPESAFVVAKIKGQPPQTRTYDFFVDVVQGAPDGVQRTMLVANGMYPGPTIEANQWDRVIVKVHNNLPNATSIHWHGLFQNGTNYYDGTAGITQCGIPPGQTFTYNFTFGDYSGTTWWHSHYSTQYTDGITGALIVHPTDPPPPDFPTWDEEVTIQVSDWYHDMSESLLVDYFSPEGITGYQGTEPVPDAATINGLGQYWATGELTGSYFNFTLKPNKAYRLRLVNTGSFANIRFSVDWHTLLLIEADGTLIEPVLAESINIAVAQRYSAILYTNSTHSENNTFWIRASLETDMFRYARLGQNRDIRGILRYENPTGEYGLPGDPHSPNPGPGIRNILNADGHTKFKSFIPDPPPEATRVYYMTMSFQNIWNHMYLAFFNTTSWEFMKDDPTILKVNRDPKGYAPEGSSIAFYDQFMITEDSVQVVELRIDYLDDGGHPFHIHGFRPWLIATGPGRYIGQSLDNPDAFRRDTFLVPAWSYYVIRFVTDNPGLWAFHCHIAWHMAAGLLMQINSLPSKTAEFDIPHDVISQCKMQ